MLCSLGLKPDLGCCTDCRLSGAWKDRPCQHVLAAMDSELLLPLHVELGLSVPVVRRMVDA